MGHDANPAAATGAVTEQERQLCDLLEHCPAALSLVEVFHRSSMAGLVDLKQIDLSVPNVLSVATAQHSEVLFGLNDLEGQLRRWRAVHEYGQRSARYVAWMDLSVANNVPARWLDPSLPAPPAPKPLKALRPKKKHV